MGAKEQIGLSSRTKNRLSPNGIWGIISRMFWHFILIFRETGVKYIPEKY